MFNSCSFLFLLIAPVLVHSPPRCQPQLEGGVLERLGLVTGLLLLPMGVAWEKRVRERIGERERETDLLADHLWWQ